MKHLLTGIIALGLVGTSQAGSPIQDEMECPLGGEKFEITSTMSCSTMGHTMNLRSVTSCDFVTKLPQCPSNGLWVYKDFTDEEIALLPNILSSEAYKTHGEKSKYFQAYQIEQALPKSDPTTSFFLLQQGMWYDGNAATLDNPAYYSAFTAALGEAAKDEEFEENDFFQAGHVMLLIHKGQLDDAKYKFKTLRANDKKDNDYYTQYLDALDYCLDKPDDEELCDLNTPIRAHIDEEEDE